MKAKTDNNSNRNTQPATTKHNAKCKKQFVERIDKKPETLYNRNRKPTHY